MANSGQLQATLSCELQFCIFRLSCYCVGVYCRWRIRFSGRLTLWRQITDKRRPTCKITKCWRQSDGKSRKNKICWRVGRIFSDNTTVKDWWVRQATESSEQNRTLSGQRVMSSRRSPKRSDGWQRIGRRQGTMADGGLRRQWRYSAANIKVCVYCR